MQVTIVLLWNLRGSSEEDLNALGLKTFNTVDELVESG